MGNHVVAAVQKNLPKHRCDPFRLVGVDYSNNYCISSCTLTAKRSHSLRETLLVRCQDINISRYSCWKSVSVPDSILAKIDHNINLAGTYYNPILTPMYFRLRVIHPKYACKYTRCEHEQPVQYQRAHRLIRRLTRWDKSTSCSMTCLTLFYHNNHN